MSPIIRQASETDLDRLCRLEKLCWRHTQTPRTQIHSRLQKYPQGQFVLEKDGEVLGVIYSQRIASADALMTRTAADVHELHDESGSIIQLLAVNVDPRAQNAGYGDQLLEFMLQRCSVMTGIERVIGVTLCKNYDAAGSQSFEEYIRLEGSNQDPVLTFHQAHGAEIVKTIPGYRPEDHANLNNGVLVAYDIPDRQRRHPPFIAATKIDREEIARFVRREAAQLLRVSESELDIDRPVMEMGLDSADLLKLQRLCEDRFGLQLQSGFFFEHSTIRKVVDHLTAGRPSEVALPLSNDSPGSEPIAATDIAIIGMSCKLPGGIETPDRLWQVLASSECVIGSFPTTRRSWPTAAEYPGIDQGGFVNDVEAFDASFFRMSPAEAQITDPQQRMLLELAWACLEDAGILPSALTGSNTGVFVGASNCDYSRLVQEAGLEIEAHNGVGSSLAILANRISYFFDLSGPSLVVDTACSSSLVALHSAVQSLRSGECAAALVGGVNLICHPDLSVAYHKAGMLSPDGRCKVFDARADGYVRSEGAVVLLLKPLRAAVAGQNRIHAVIRGSATNHGGLAGGLTVPNPQKQKELLLAAWKDAGIAARDLTYIEAHGTGTSLGDPIEIQGIQAAYAEPGSTNPAQPCAIGSVKSNLGHLESAAGITGLLKVVLSLQHQQLPASVHFSKLNPKIRIDDSPFFIQDRFREWDGEQPRLAAVSSFGSGGANAHVVVQKYSSNVPSSSLQDNFLFVLSAANEDRLRVYVSRVIHWLEREATGTNFVDAIFTWQVGRTAMKQRLAIKVKDHQDLLNKLKEWFAGNNNVADVWSSQVVPTKDSSFTRVWQTRAGRQLIDQALSEKDWELLGTLWVSAIEIDWRKYYDGMGKVISLPAYPFARDRYWIETSPRAATATLHPLLHTNTSDLSHQSYSSTFTGDEFFLKDHQVDGRKILPAVAYLEMARVAIEQAAHPSRETVLELHNTVWVQPLVVSEKTEVRIVLSGNDHDEIGYEVYSQDVHCQGRAVFSRQPAPANLDIEQIKAQMPDQLAANTVYAALGRMGLAHGPSFQSVTAIHRGRGQLLAELRLPHTFGDYVLHPSVMDGGLQAAVGLVEGEQRQLPFALETLRILSPCTPHMCAWVRYDEALKVDIDLCDERGNVCVQMRGLSLRAAQGQAAGSLLTTPVWQASNAGANHIEYEEHHVVRCESQQYSECALACFERIQAILRGKPQGKVLVQVVGTEGLLAGLSGLLKTAALENPQIAGQLILVPADTTDEELARYLEAEKSHGQDPLIRYENGTRQVLRWEEVPAESEQPPMAFKDDGVYLITGGRGGLGMLFAREILEQTREARVVLTGRSAWSTQGERVSYRQVDHGDLDQVRQLIVAIKEEYGKLNGILHCAGMIADNFILKKSSAEFREVLLPKVTGTFNLDQASQDVELDFFVLFSSMAGAMGNVGQADYATANGFMDQFAAYRNRQVAARQRHGRTRSINWPLWEAGGMKMNGASQEVLQQTTGMRPMQTATGFDAFYRVLALPYDQILVAEGDRSQMRRALFAGNSPPQPRRGKSRRSLDWGGVGQENHSFDQHHPGASRRPSSAEEGSLQEKTQDYLRKQLSGVLKLPFHKIDPRAALENYGIDSMLAMKLTNQLEKTFGSLSKTLFFEYQTIGELSEYFIAHHSSRLTTLFAATTNHPTEATPTSTNRRFISARSAPSRPATEADSIAIIGLSGRYPEAINIDAYWENLREGKDCIIEVPTERWDWREYFSDDRNSSGRHYSKWGGFIAGVDEFDPLFFNIAPKEAKYIDPQERLFLQHAWMAIEDAGYTRASLQVPYAEDLPGQVGVYVGVMYSEYQLFGAEASVEDLRMGFAGNLASIANRVSYALNLHGPSMTLDTMCSSSLTAIHVATQDLKSGRTSLAIAGGVNVSVHPNKYLMLSVGQFISSDGHCQSFGEGGDGYIPGEGVGVVVLKRLSEAKRDGDHIYGIIRGSALTHGGKTNGYSVPNPQAQTSAISRALTESHTDARHVSYIEAHGTGTKLGDPIEIAALSKAFHPYTQDTEFCLIGSAKSNIGHCESAAGIAGLTKVLLQMQHQQIVPSLHSAQLNPHIDFPRSPFVVNQSLRTWEQPVIDGRKLPRIAGISSFGAGGSNAHMIVEEYQSPEQQPVTVAPVVILLSARTGEQLQQKAHELLDFVRAQLNTIDLVSMAYTLQVGREAMDERLGFVVNSVEQLADKLHAYVMGEQNIEDIYQGQVKHNKEALSLFSSDVDLQHTIDKWIATRKFTRLLDLWVKGLELDWSKLYGEAGPQRISLPTYPFARERYWIERAGQMRGVSYEQMEECAPPPPSVDSDVLPAVTATLKTLLANELLIQESDIDENVQFVDLGLDSVTGVTWIRKINEKYRTSIEAVKVYSYPTLIQLSRYVKEEAGKHGTLSGLGTTSSPPERGLKPATTLQRRGRTASTFTRDRVTHASHSMAVIGMAGQFPQAKNLEDFWQNIAQARNCITLVPRDRWDVNACYHPGDTMTGKTNCQWVGALEEYDRFDPLFFNISPRDAESMDPQQRLFLQACWHSIEDAGYDARSLSGHKCGVFVGCTYGDYHLLSREQQLSAQGFTGDATSILAARISYFLNLQGPCLSIDTACSSSLVAIAHACDSLTSGASDLALAGGVHVMAGPDMHIKASQAGMLSPEGRCFTFDQRADGFVPGEGVGVVVLKRLADAQKDKDIIYAVIQGWGVNHDGKTNGITAPNLESQTLLEQDVYDKYQINPANIQLIEAHGTGTKLGDPIEVAGLKKAFKKYTGNQQYCALGSVKSNIGHCITAGGVAGFIKLVLALQHKQLPPTINFERLNEHIDLKDSPFYVNSRLQEWKLGGAAGRQGAVSSFGFSGTNAHVVVGEYLPPAEVRLPVSVISQDTKIIVPLSARTEEQLKQKARNLVDFIHRHAQSADLVEMAYTLQVGREAMEQRLGLLVSSVEQLAERLQAYVNGEPEIKDLYQGQVKRSKESVSIISQDDEMKETIIAKCLADKKLSRLLDLWVKGLDLDWNKLYGETKPQRINLPTYPFAKQRYWIEKATRADTAVLHPLLHTNTSDLSRQSYSSTFTGDEPFLSDHQRIFPAAAYLEMARVAVEKAARPSEQMLLELRDVVWAKPLVVGESKRVSITLWANENDEIDYEIYSHDAGQEIVHCHGRAVCSRQAAPARLDLEELRPQIVRLPRIVENTSADYVLHPTLMDGALQSAIGLIDGGPQPNPRLPLTLDSLLIVSPCTPEMFAWVRYDKLELNIDLCDERGNITAQIRGMNWQQAATRKEIAVVASKKTTGISLVAPAAFVPAALPPKRKLAITLSSTVASSANLCDCGNGVFSIQVTNESPDLLHALDNVRQEASLKVLLLSGLDRCFLRGGREAYNDAIEQKLYQALMSFPYPVIAVLHGDTIGADFMAAALCDFMVCNEDATYGYTDADHHLYPTTPEVILFGERFGQVFADELLYVSTASTGRQLRTKGWTCPILPPAQVQPYAQKLASALATKSQEALRLLKRHLARHLVGLVNGLTRIEAAMPATVANESVVVVTDLRQAFATIHENASCKAVVLASESGEFLPEMEHISEDVVLGLQHMVVESRIPVIAALDGNAKGAAWLISQFCDACVYSQTGVYSSAGTRQTPALAQMAAAIFTHRLGNVAGKEILFSGADYRGVDLQQRVGALIVEEQDHVLPAAIKVAEFWARLPRATLDSLKQRTASMVQEKIRRVPARWDEKDETPDLLPAAPTSIALHSKVVTATAHPEGIVLVKMEDRQAKNMFSDAFMEGVREVFAHIEQTPGYKVVILTGFDSYFASGGTKESLLAIQQGKARFTDFKIFQLPLDCKLPVIAAMQGHGIGAGWSLGMFADIVLLSEESRYVSPYMNYGFTPGAGATYILADKLGHDLARESLLTAQPCSGRELKDRGVTLRILPRADVVPAAMALARQIAQASRDRLIGLKQQSTGDVRQLLDETYRLELAMHEKTFVGQSDTFDRIQKNFYQEVAAPVSPSEGSDVPSDVTASLKTLLANELHMRASDIDENVEFVDLGLDSISGVTWMRKINEKYHTSIEATKVYRYPTLTKLSRYVKEEAEKHGTLPRPETPPAPRERGLKPAVTLQRRSRTASRFTSGVSATSPSHAIAVIGMSGRFPGAENLEEFWQNLEQGKNCITEIPASRWDVNRYYEPESGSKDRLNSKWLGALDDVDCFDPLFFRISPQEAEYIDPQHRLFLQESYKAFEDAGYSSSILSNKKCGVYLGISTNEYASLLVRNGVRSTPVTSNSFAIAAARIAYHLNLKGPAISVDTACSSSLVAIHLACQGLLNGETDMALAGGVSVWLAPDSYLSMSQAGMLSSTGQCRTFDDAADGIVVGEGVGALVLKRLQDAQKDNDFIYGVILGSGINQDGRTNGITAPSVESQIELERSVYARYKIDPETISYVEAHGTGTRLGDPIELEALAAAFNEKATKKNYCGLGSVKSNIGHTAAAAGVASVLKVLLSMGHRMLVPTLNVTKENSHFDFANSPFYICRERQAWDVSPGSTRRAAVSSFGYSGTNAHLVMEEYSPAEQVAPSAADSSFIIPLSARTAEQLQQKARDLLKFIRASSKSIELADVAYTLQVGREAMEERLSLVVSSVDQLAEKLGAYIAGQKNIEGVQQGRVEGTDDGVTIIGRDEDMQEALDKWISRKKLSKLLDLWIRGLNFDWNKLYADVKPRRTPLPAYPFARDRYWIDEVTSSPGPDSQFTVAGNMKSIEDIIDQIDDDTIETEHAVQALKMLV